VAYSTFRKFSSGTIVPGVALALYPLWKEPSHVASPLCRSNVTLAPVQNATAIFGTTDVTFAQAALSCRLIHLITPCTRPE
jgi:hypothetical protein